MGEVKGEIKDDVDETLSDASAVTEEEDNEDDDDDDSSDAEMDWSGELGNGGRPEFLDHEFPPSPRALSVEPLIAVARSALEEVEEDDDDDHPPARRSARIAERKMSERFYLALDLLKGRARGVRRVRIGDNERYRRLGNRSGIVLRIDLKRGRFLCRSSVLRGAENWTTGKDTRV